MTKAFPRKLPYLSWAWPTGARHQLITAAICPDKTRALDAIRTWLRETDLDDATFAEHRLLAAITTRFDAALRDEPAYARLGGLQRLNWTKSRMAIAAVKPALEAMIADGITPILMKGAARVALDPSEQKSRTSYDLDLLLSQDDFVAAFEILAQGGWQSTRGESVLGLRARIASVRARNFKKGRFGDIDLHQSAYHAANQNAAVDRALFADAVPVSYYDMPVLVPVAEERLAMALGHGGWDGHSHSDWLVDAASILENEPLDWDKFMHIIMARKLAAPAAVALSYLHYDIGLGIPAQVRNRICGRSRLASPRQLAAMFLAKESSRLTRSQRLARGVVENLQRLRHSGRDKLHDTPVFRAFARPKSVAAKDPPAMSSQVVPFDAGEAGEWCFALTALVTVPPRQRRIEFELNAPARNICHLQAFHFRKSACEVAVRFSGKFSLSETDFPLTLHALPGKLLEEGAAVREQEKYGALPFSLTDVAFRPVG